MKHIAPEVEIGDIVHYYTQADPGTKPVAAIVTDIGGNGVLHLNRIPKNGFQLIPASGVMHIDDPALKKFPEAARSKGAWDLKVADRKTEMAKLQESFKEVASTAPSKPKPKTKPKVKNALPA